MRFRRIAAALMITGGVPSLLAGKANLGAIATR